MSFYALQVSFAQIYYEFAKKPDKLFWARLKEKTFAFLGKCLEHLESREELCVHCPEVLTVSAGPGYKVFREWIRCLYNNVTDCLCVATSQSINDRREQMVRLDHSTSSDPSPICAINVLTCITSRDDLKRTMCVFWSSTSRLSLL